MKQANSLLFSNLESFCIRRGETLENPGKVRYVSSDTVDREFLKNLKVSSVLKFGNHRSLSHLRLADQHYIGLIGFDFEPTLSTLIPLTVNGGMAVCLLSTIQPAPSVGPASVRNIVEVASAEDPEYSGHSADAIQSLFPVIQVLECSQVLDEDAVWRIYLMICAEECMRGGSWIGDKLSDALVTLTGLAIPSMPYPAICRSMFDADPRSLFMALYRCIEATYAYESSRRLVDRLNLSVRWQEVAEALDDEIGWHPQEAQSLNLVLQHAVEQDLADICECLSVSVREDREIHPQAGKAIYALRNKIVHFRSASSEPYVDETDWNRLCYLLVGVVFSVFTQAYS
ncbi:hypothetical protein [Kribbella sp. NPDC050470]|uniref:hypothetical protein n=1 Tax=unclassified Kribbella TaxID=2644121 RepID=UPI0037A3E7E4